MAERRMLMPLTVANNAAVATALMVAMILSRCSVQKQSKRGTQEHFSTSYARVDTV